jgi:MazG family protein
MNEHSPEFPQLARLLQIVRDLRERCPWDREQKLADVTKYLIEEAYEVADAIAQRKPDSIADELGDLLVQVLFAAVVAEQRGHLTVGALCERAAQKLIRRHPHVYGESKANTTAEVLVNWNRIKSEERKAEGFHSALDGIARSLPSLMLAQKLGSRARQAGMDWADIHDVLGKVREEMDELEGALAADDSEAAADELGDMLLALANAPRFLGHDAEETLRRACEKFSRRFKAVEQFAASRGLEMNKMTPAELESLWQEVKQSDRAAAIK